MRFTLEALAQRFGLELFGDARSVIEGVCALNPGLPGHLSFCAESRFLVQAKSTLAPALVAAERIPGYSGNLLLARNPLLAFARISALFDDAYDFVPGIDETAVVAGDVALSPTVHIGPHAVVEAGVQLGEGCFLGPGCILRKGAILGAGCRLEANVYVGPRCRLGARVHVLPGAVIGGRGFGNVPGEKGWEEIPQLGVVRIGDDVEVGANTTIDRGALADTVIESGVRLDNLIQVAHNCVIGRDTAIAACTGLAGSSRIGARCMIGGAVVVGGHLTIGDGVTVLGRSGVTKSLSGPGVYGGFPAVPVKEWHYQVARVRRLNVLEDRLSVLEKSRVPGAGDDKNGA
ncbi:MAG: UDP-3-O-(3-hydroxymyristoyl)glucosamine N-acyltransferase [Nevskiaceae bacterium]|nr:MAG: UDP-3-O-(3-hydroxymyristoyl)glucosamine N-acyltransferase [Nevskiaceae bacterium]TBR71780.1 MAG: UDP-3-O-(3-hydroxymyristoyl)glucosamine N-acyltransferase [Nevskiaceae bacterium]